jgi:hypothetical protein
MIYTALLARAGAGRLAQGPIMPVVRTGADADARPSLATPMDLLAPANAPPGRPARIPAAGQAGGRAGNGRAR